MQRQPSLSSDSSDTESAYATTDSEDRGQSRGRSKGHRSMDKKIVAIPVHLSFPHSTT
jgi:hypothetical protein